MNNEGNIEKKLRADTQSSNEQLDAEQSQQRLIEDSEERRTQFIKKVQINDEFLTFDFSKTHFTAKEYEELENHLKEQNFDSLVNEMFEGKPINFTENRPVLHTLLRDPEILEKINSEENDFEGNKKLVFDELIKIKSFCKDIHSSKIKSSTNKKFKYIVNIGIGGSDLGPNVVCEALEFYKLNHMKIYFVSNVDPAELHHALTKVKLDETLFVVVSKTFTTQETMSNANLALDIVSRLLKKKKELISDKHFIAISSNLEEVTKFGIQRVFNMWDFVGGRFSLWSAAGISIALYAGFDNFLKLLIGASKIDQHFLENPLSSVCTMHALVELYYSSLNYPTRCIVPYDYYLRNFYLHLQQVDMESNGKIATKNNERVQDSGLIVWGGVGTNSQHSFFQLLHQGTHKVLVEFLYPLNPLKDYSTDISHHSKLIANCLGQSDALAYGKSNSDLHKQFDGNKPSLTICYSKLTPEILGALIAHYEQKVFVFGAYKQINSFDQFGVALGKEVAKENLKYLATKEGDVREGTKVKLEEMMN